MGPGWEGTRAWRRLVKGWHRGRARCAGQAGRALGDGTFPRLRKGQGSGPTRKPDPRPEDTAPSPSASSDWQCAPFSFGVEWGREYTPGPRVDRQRDTDPAQLRGHATMCHTSGHPGTTGPSHGMLPVHRTEPGAAAEDPGAGKALGEVGMGLAGSAGHHPHPCPRKCLCWVCTRKNSLCSKPHLLR